MCFHITLCFLLDKIFESASLMRVRFKEKKLQNPIKLLQ